MSQTKSRRSVCTVGTVADIVLEQSLAAIVANMR
jgi:hypothetical protein